MKATGDSNSTGNPALIWYTGSTSISANNLTLTTSQCPRRVQSSTSSVITSTIVACSAETMSFLRSAALVILREMPPPRAVLGISTV